MIALIPPRMPFLIRAAMSVALLSHLRLALAAATCYNKDGVQLNGVLPCNETAEVGPCCSLGSICLSNGLCSPGPEVVNHGFVDYYRPDGCTNPTWNTTACFSGCNKFQGNGLSACDVGKFCCYDMAGCVCSATSLFSLGTARFITTLPLSPTSSSMPVSTSAVTTTSVTTTSVTTSPTASPATAASNQAATTSPTQSAESSSKNSAALGAGIGVGLGVPILALSIILVIVIKRSKKRNAYSVPGQEKHEMEAPHGLNEAPEEYYSPAQKSDQLARMPQEMDAHQSRQFTPGWGWHR